MSGRWKSTSASPCWSATGSAWSSRRRRSRRDLAKAFGQGLGQIAAAARDLAQRGAQRPLRIATTPSFAAGWLMPRMSAFWRDHPEVEVEVLSSHGLVDLRRDRIDVALRYGLGNWRGTVTESLVPAEFMAVAAPGLFPPGADLASLTGATWLTYSPYNEEQAWLHDHGIDLGKARVRILSSAELVIEAVKGGVGIGILTRAVAGDALAQGTMEIIASDEGKGGPAYHIVTQPDVHNPVRDVFVKWLRGPVAD